MDATYQVPQDLIDRLRVTYTFDMNAYLDAYYYFLLYQYPLIISYYQGNLETIDQSNFNSLSSLANMSTQLMNILRESKDDFISYSDWQFIDYVTDMNEKVLMMSKVYKFVRSSKVKTNFSSELKYEYNIGQNESLERISRKQLNNSSPDNDWQNIAIENNIKEIDYTSETGNNIVLAIKLNSQALGITSIIDSVEGIRVLGLDLSQQLSFIENDLFVLDYNKTFEQCVAILLNLLKEDIPEFPDMGRTINIGSNVNVFTFGSNVREIAEAISSDDSIVDFTILNINNDFANKQVFINCSLRSRLDQISVTKTIQT